MAKVYATAPYLLTELGRGQNVAATTIWRGPFGSPDDTRERRVEEESVGILVPAERSYDVALSATIPIQATALTYEQLPHILEAGIMTATPTGSGPYSRVYSFPTGTTPNAIQIYTIRAGNVLATADVQVIPYAFVSEFTLSGKQGEPWTMEATWMGQQMSSGSFTGGLSLPAVEEALFGNSEIFLDVSGGTIGTTQITGVLMEFSLKVTTGIVWVPAKDGTLYPTAHKFTRPAVTYTLRLELEQDTGASVVATQRTRYRANSTQLLRMSCAGSGSRLLQIDLAAKNDKIGAYEESDGNITVNIEGHAAYSSTDALFAEITVDNTLATL